MRKRYYPASISRFDRWWQELDSQSVIYFLTLPIAVPVWLAKVTVIGLLVGMIIFVMVAYPSACTTVLRAFREAVALGQTDYDSTRLKGGETRQTGSGRKGSLIRPGGSLSSDDLRRRLYELRTSKTERMNRRAPNVGGQNGKQ